MTNLQIFGNKQFGSIRAVQQGNKVLLCGSDVAKALGYVNTKDALSRHCKKDGVAFHDLTDTLGRKQKAKFINEGNVYRLITHSKLPQAEEFEKWVFDDVLPSIRKNGAYMTGETLEKALTSPDFLIELAQKLKEEKEQRLILQNHNKLLELEVCEYKPKAEYVDKILESKGTLTVTQIAADYGLSARQLNAILHEEKIQHKVGEQWILYKKHMGSGYTKSETIDITHRDGTPDTKMQTKWAQRGRLLIHNILESRGIKANMDK